MNDTIQICSDTISNCDSICNNINSCRCEVEKPAAEDSPAPKTQDLGAYVIAAVGIVMALCVGCLLWRVKNSLKKEIEDLHAQLEGYSEKLVPLQDDISSLSATMADISKKTNDVERNARNRSWSSNDNHSKISNSKVKATFLSVRYATLQAPDENGVLRFAERSMVETPSAEKMFILELDLNKEIGTYRINPKAIPLILGDLQMFRDFVKTFSFSGNVSNATIKDKKMGRITRQGSYWVVDEKLEITIK